MPVFRVQLFATLWTVARQAPLSMGFSRQVYWRGLPFPSPGDLPHPGIEPMSLVSLSLAGGFFTTEPPGKPFSMCPPKFCVPFVCNSSVLEDHLSRFCPTTPRLEKCSLTAACCRPLSSVLGSSKSLENLNLLGNNLGPDGVSRLWMPLRKPTCKLRKLG